MAEIFKGIERNPGVATSGFYVMRMKKDVSRGHYVGVATWIPHDQPLPGSRVAPKSTVEPVLGNTGSSEEQNLKHRNASFGDQKSEMAMPYALVEDSRSEFNQSVEKISADRRPARGTTMFDPYDSYDL